MERITNGLRPAIAIAGEPPMKLADRMNELHVPGVSIAVIHGGVIQACGFGAAGIDGPSVTPETMFQAGSISKPVSAVAALALAQAGKLDLDSDVDLLLKTWKIPVNSYTDKSKVTLRRLLDHSAGITVHGFPGYAAGAAIPHLVDVLNGAPPANSAPIVVGHEPGTRFQYSGGGYTIMQQLLIDVTGKPFPDLVGELVLKPFGMTHSGFFQPLPKEDVQSAATPYRPTGAPVPGGAHIYPELAAAGLWTTPTDLARFALAVLEAWAGRNTSVLSQATAVQMLTPGFGDYGLGPIVRGSSPNRSFLHGGGNEGFFSLMVAFENGDGAIIMTNGARGGELANEIMHSIAIEYDWSAGQPKIRQRTTVDPRALDRLVGTYELSPQFFIHISKEEGRLFAQATGQDRFEIFPESDRDFFLTAVDAVLTFDAESPVSATQLILHQNGMDRVAKRVSSVPQRSRRKAVADLGSSENSTWSVLLLNDDYTPMEFVMDAIKRFFDMDRESATHLMLRIHNEGIAECGAYSREMAKTKAAQVIAFAREHRHPLQCVIERKP
jgi:CubicO group peptidase (beta-lactamase class C family)/ATP-dependent Clp protease adapter protein ClpS